MRSLPERLWTKVDVPLTAVRRTCWNWRGARSLKRGGSLRPVIYVKGRTMIVARVVCEWVNGPAPTDKHQAGHTCPDGENSNCVSPFHLQWMTPYENLKYRDGRR